MSSNPFGIPPEIWGQVFDDLNEYDLYRLTLANKRFEHLIEIPPFLSRCIEDGVTLPSDQIVTLAKEQKTPIDWETFYNKRPYDTDFAESLEWSHGTSIRCVHSLTETSCRWKSQRKCAFIPPEIDYPTYAFPQTELVFSSTGLPEWAWKAQGGGLRCLIDGSTYKPFIIDFFREHGAQIAFVHAWSGGSTRFCLPVYQSRQWEKTNFFISFTASTSLKLGFMITEYFRLYGFSVRIDQVDVIRPSLFGSLVPSRLQQEKRDFAPAFSPSHTCTCCLRRAIDVDFQSVFPPLRFAADEKEE